MILAIDRLKRQQIFTKSLIVNPMKLSSNNPLGKYLKSTECDEKQGDYSINLDDGVLITDTEENDDHEPHFYKSGS